MKKTYKRILAATLASILVWNTCEWQPRALAGSKVYQIEEVKALPESVLHQEVAYGTKYKDLELPDKLSMRIWAEEAPDGEEKIATASELRSVDEEASPSDASEATPSEAEETKTDKNWKEVKVRWVLDETFSEKEKYDGKTPGVYVFDAELKNSRYELDTGFLPRIEVTVLPEEAALEITEFFELDETIQVQNLALGAKESDIVLPDTLDVQVENLNEGDVEEADAATEDDKAADGKSTEEPAGDEKAQYQLTGITWQLDENQSDLPEFHGGISVQEYFDEFDEDGEPVETEEKNWAGYAETNQEYNGHTYVYTPVLPEDLGEHLTGLDSETAEKVELAEKIELPEIYVLVGEMQPMTLASKYYDISEKSIIIDSPSVAQQVYNGSIIYGNTDKNNIIISGSSTVAFLTIQNLDIEIGSQWKPAIGLRDGATLHLTLSSNNVLKGGEICAAIDVPKGCTLIIEGNGSLEATGADSAGIGASRRGGGTLGEITIHGGDIKAYGSGMSAGIGGTKEGDTGTVTITGGTIYAEGGTGSYNSERLNRYSGAGIGGGAYGCVEKIYIRGGNITAQGGYTTWGHGYPGPGIGCGYGAKPIEGGYKCGDIYITGGTVSASAINNEVNAIGVGERADWRPERNDKLEGSITISEDAEVNLNGGTYYPEDVNASLKKYRFNCTVYDGRLTESSYPAKITVGNVTWDAGTMKVGNNSINAYTGTISPSNYLKPSEKEQPVDLKVGDYTYDLGTVELDAEESKYITVGTPLYETRLKFVSLAINQVDEPLTVSRIVVKQDGKELITGEEESNAIAVPSNKITYSSDYTGYMSVYLPENDGQTDISVTVLGLNNGKPITVSGQTISKWNVNEITMYEEDISCQHESFDADGFCAVCKNGYQPAEESGGYYQVRNAGQLFWFAEQINSGKIEADSNLKLMKDIEIPDGHYWNRINTTYSGTMDGNYHVISGLRYANGGSGEGILNRIEGGNVKNLGLIFRESESGNKWGNGLCYCAADNTMIENCFVAGKISGAGFFERAYKTTMKNCFDISDSSGVNYESLGECSIENSYQRGSRGTATQASEEQFKSGEIAYKLNDNTSEGVWGQNLDTDGGDAYPQFRKYSKTVYENNGSYSNNRIITIASLEVRNITSTRAEICMWGLPSGANIYYKEGEVSDLSELLNNCQSFNGIGTAGDAVISRYDLLPNTEYTYSFVASKDVDGKKVYSDIRIVTFRTAQAAPAITDISIDYEKEELKNRASEPLEFAESDNSSSWTTITVKGYVSLTDILDKQPENTTKISLYLRKKASGSGAASETAEIQIPARQEVGQEKQPVLSYTDEMVTVPVGVQYMFGKTSPTDWKSAETGSGTAVSITKYISKYKAASENLNKVYYRGAASNEAEMFAGKMQKLDIPARPQEPDKINEDKIVRSYNWIGVISSNDQYEYGIVDEESVDTREHWQQSSRFEGLQPAHTYMIAVRTKATDRQFASEPGVFTMVITLDILKIAGSGEKEFVTQGTYGQPLSQVSLRLADGYGVYNSHNEPISGTWNWYGGDSNNQIYPEVNGTTRYDVVFTPNVPGGYGYNLGKSICPDISPKELNAVLTLPVEKTYDGSTEVTVDATVETGITGQTLKINGLKGRFADANVGTDKRVTLDSSEVTVTAGERSTHPDNYQVVFPTETTGTIYQGQGSVSIDPQTWTGQKTYGDDSFPLTGVIVVGDGVLTYTSSDESVLTVDAQGVATIKGAGSAEVSIMLVDGMNCTGIGAPVIGQIEVKKAPAPSIIWAAAASVEAGSPLSASALTGGSTEYGSFSWKNPAQLAEAGTHSYEAVFTPNEWAERNYEIAPVTGMVELTATVPPADDKNDTGNSGNNENNGNNNNNSNNDNSSNRGSSGGHSSSSRSTTGTTRTDSVKGKVNSDKGILTGANNSTANDGYSHWMQDEHGWWLRFADNSYPKAEKRAANGIAYAWEQINGNWWAFDENGYIKTGWMRDEDYGGWFYADLERGMLIGWHLIDGKWYYFHPTSDGMKGLMYAGRRTPDGYYVDENGAWDGR